jgi:hypothetical protein
MSKQVSYELNRKTMMNKQVITNMLLTKEALAAYIYDIKVKQAAEYGLTVEQYEQAVINGTVLIPVHKSEQS